MANKYQVVDEILKQQGEGTYNVTFTNLNITDTNNPESVEVVGAITDEVKRKITYDDLSGAPGIPDEGYQVVNNTQEPKDFHKVAFTGNYAHLNDAPAIPLINGQKPTEFDPIAFTGSISLDNVQVSNVINFYAADASSNSPRITATLEPAGIVNEYNYRLANLGSEDTYILGFAYNGDPLANTISQFAMKFRNKQLPSFFVTKAGTFLVLDIEFNPTTLEYTNYIKFTLAQVNEAYYNGGSTINQNNIDPQDDQLIDAKNILNNITFTKKNISFIFDYVHQAIFCKTNTADDASQIDTSNFIIHANQIPELKQVATTGSYNDLTNKPILDVSANNSNITGLAQVAKTGDYNDLNNTFYTINFGDFIYKYDSVNDNWSTLTGNEYNYLYSCGLITGSVKNINKLYNSNDDETNITLVNKAKFIYNNFNNNKLCYLISNNKKYLITDMVATNDNGNMVSLLINCTFNSSTNYNTIMNNNNINFNSNEDIQTILDDTFEIKYKTTVIFLDLSNNILYSIARQIYPISIVDSSLYIGNKNTNTLGIKLSGKENNVLSVFNGDNLSENEKGLYLGYEEPSESEQEPGEGT